MNYNKKLPKRLQHTMLMPYHIFSQVKVKLLTTGHVM